ncbi:TPA: proline--tRNA ligase [Patescibacteria group bacterium]|uniref:Proline--tRNA ligase n=1 Tax=Candidatus Gottesmanbacteria bacterium GW2011_GWA1_43_11 TaxID=1618436 RepID=A0A0G1CHA5_9BACT|nr:MAG: Proline-tRNA ligase [Candidatus Gottesmanbacteria bacterium GW2011_GWA1_43_11]HCS79408.1 proline--tRNA ligase [Patescibacteria group bacterium]
MQQFEKKELKKKSENISDWYTDVVLKAELADYAPVKGTMVIRPYGYAIWERVQEILNRMMRTKGVQNAYFPLFIPSSLLEKEKQHVKGFSPELAIVTIAGGEKLVDPLVVRPTSETIMYAMYAKWIHSWRDLPLLINQWNNAVRWEKRSYLFLRTTEFLWQEGHTAHETEGEAIDMVLAALEWYQNTYQEFFAVPVISGRKSTSEKFAGGKETYAIEALMPDGKALQAATSHNLGQNFSKPFVVSFQNREGKIEYVWQTSWGFSTRALGGLFLVHGDDHGLILPPKMAPFQVVIIPIFKKGLEQSDLITYGQLLAEDLEAKGIRVMFDKGDNQSAGRKFNAWEVKGVPLRIEIGEREMHDKTVTLVKRIDGEKFTIARAQLGQEILQLLDSIQQELFQKALEFLKSNIREANSYDEFKAIMQSKRGFIKAFWCESAECEAKIKTETKATTRCLPLDAAEEKGECIYCKKEAHHRWFFAQAY